MSWRRLLIILLPLLAVPLTLLLVTALAAQEAGGLASCDAPTGNYPTIQSAVDDPGCDTVNVAAGTFYENVVIGRNVSVRGRAIARQP